MNGLAYKANAAEVFERLRQLIARKAQDRIFAAFILPTQAMKDFQKQYSGGFSTEYPDPEERIQFWDRHLSERRLIEDDSIPAAYPSEFDQGLYGGILGGDVRFLSLPDDGYVGSGWISSMVPPLLADWSEFERLRFDGNSLWYQRYLRQLRLMRDAARGKYGISHLIVIDSFNFVYELVGATNTYLSMYEAPARVKEAIEFAYHLNLKIHNTFFDSVGTLEGGTCSWVVPWIPGRIICESVDPFHMTSPRDFETLGKGAAGAIGESVRWRRVAPARQRLVPIGGGLLAARHQGAAAGRREGPPAGDRDQSRVAQTCRGDAVEHAGGLPGLCCEARRARVAGRRLLLRLRRARR